MVPLVASNGFRAAQLAKLLPEPLAFCFLSRCPFVGVGWKSSVSPGIRNTFIPPPSSILLSQTCSNRLFSRSSSGCPSRSTRPMPCVTIDSWDRLQGIGVACGCAAHAAKQRRAAIRRLHGSPDLRSRTDSGHLRSKSWHQTIRLYNNLNCGSTDIRKYLFTTSAG